MSILLKLMTDPPTPTRSPLFDLMETRWGPESPPPLGHPRMPPLSEREQLAKLLRSWPSLPPTNSNAVLSPFKPIPFSGIFKDGFWNRSTTLEFSAEVTEWLRDEDDREI